MASPGAPALRLHGVGRTFRTPRGPVVALAEVSFSVAPGEFVACLGPNGAGKSTAVKLLTGILHPSAGEVEVLGLSPQRRRVALARRIGAVFGQKTQLWWDLPVRDSLELLAAIYGVPASLARQRLRLLDDALGFGGFVDRPVRLLSLGQRMRADLAAALLHGPEVLFLDEPTVGLDVAARQAVRRFLAEVGGAGTTILLTTHDMGDVEALCRLVVILAGGRLRYDGGLEALRAAAGLPTVAVVEFAAPPATPPASEAAAAGVAVQRSEGALLEVGFDRARSTVGGVLAWLGRYGEVRDVRLAEPDLDAVLRGFYHAGPSGPTGRAGHADLEGITALDAGAAERTVVGGD